METLDPICGMTVDPAHAAATRVTVTGTEYFCSLGCAAAFDRQQPQGDGGAGPATAAARARRRAGVAMLAAFAVAVAVLVALLLAGLGSAALSIAAGVLLVSCLTVCGVAALVHNRALKEVEQATSELAEHRRAQASGQG